MTDAVNCTARYLGLAQARPNKWWQSRFCEVLNGETTAFCVQTRAHHRVHTGTPKEAHGEHTAILWEDFNAVWIITILLGLRNVRWIIELVEPSACLAINKFLSQCNHKSTLCSFSCRVCHFYCRYLSLCVNWRTVRSASWRWRANWLLGHHNSKSANTWNIDPSWAALHHALIPSSVIHFFFLTGHYVHRRQ